MSGVLDGLLNADQKLFLWLNGHHNAFWDVVMAAFTYKFTWIPLYVGLAYFLIDRYKAKALGYIWCMIAVVALSDQIASGLFKPYFLRLRPCHDPVIGSLVHVVGGCGGQYGFVSSHAATGFGIASCFNLMVPDKVKWAPWLFVWAFVYSFSRIYVGVHYPLDLLGGTLLGLLTSFVLVGIYRFLARYFPSRFF